jgi:polysaccharide biosynthesis protein PslH
MRLLVISARFPEAGGKGDQSRAFSFISHLAPAHDVAVVSAARASTAEAEAALRAVADVDIAATGPALRGVASLWDLVRLRPAQIGWMMPAGAWRRARERAATADVVLVNTSRSLRGPLPAPIVLDHVDALSLNMRRRASGPERLPIRAAARLEAVLMRRWERQAARWCAGQVATTVEDAANLPADPRCEVIPVGWDARAGAGDRAERDLDVVLSGNMGYPPNRDAAEWFASEILPAVRHRRPGTSALVVGRDASALRLSGVEIASDVPDLLAYLRRAKVAIAPLRMGTGAPYKVLEAAASGPAVVATPWAAKSFGLPPTGATAEELARRTVELLDDEALRAEQARAGLAVAQRHRGDQLARRLEELLQHAARRATPAVGRRVPVG